jgi:hypothetical protein
VLFIRPDRFIAGACVAQNAGRTLDAILKSMSFIPGATATNTALTDGAHALASYSPVTALVHRDLRGVPPYGTQQRRTGRCRLT